MKQNNMTVIAETMANLVAVTRNFSEQYENIRECPFYSELKGMERMLKMLGIEFEYEYDASYTITAVMVDGCKAIAQQAAFPVGG